MLVAHGQTSFGRNHDRFFNNYGRLKPYSYIKDHFKNLQQKKLSFLKGFEYVALNKKPELEAGI